MKAESGLRFFPRGERNPTVRGTERGRALIVSERVTLGIMMALVAIGVVGVLGCEGEMQDDDMNVRVRWEEDAEDVPVPEPGTPVPQPTVIRYAPAPEQE